jgi:hypothetical protein
MLHSRVAGLPTLFERLVPPGHPDALRGVVAIRSLPDVGTAHPRRRLHGAAGLGSPGPTVDRALLDVLGLRSIGIRVPHCSWAVRSRQPIPDEPPVVV